MKSFIFPCLAALSSLSLAGAADTSDSAPVPTSTDASAFLSDVWAGQTDTPTWATGKYATTLASALYSVETSFVLASGYSSIVEAIWSAAKKDGGSEVVESLSASYWDWGAVTTNDWYTKNVPKALQTEVVKYDSAWGSAMTSVYDKVAAATATGSSNAAAAPVPRCTGMAVAGIVAGVAAMAGVV